MTGHPALDRVLGAVAPHGQLPSGAAAAHAPGSIELIGEPCSRTGGMLITAALPVSAAVALVPTKDGTLTVRSNGSVHTMDMPESVPEDLPQPVASVAAAVVALAHIIHVIPRMDAGLDITIESDIPAQRGLGDIAAVQSAIALAANELWGDRDDVPARARLASALQEAQAAHVGEHVPLYPYTAALRAKAGHVLLCNHADGAVTQLPLPDQVALTALCSADLTGGSAPANRHGFFADACRTFGVPTLAALPDADTRVVEWIRARHEVDANSEAPTEGRAARWLEETAGSSDRARALSGHIRHGDVSACLATIRVDTRTRDKSIDPDNPLGRLITAANNAGAACRCVSAPGAAAVAWGPAELAEDIRGAIHGAGGWELPLTGAAAGLIWKA
ncbi:hypothetical protein KRX51_07790 [Corynebacterium sp. TAE3-ERU12]|uniref:GHMP family kinase ATP-binding protein n=1 Tax=Corynebacterium sp. TAE3-ERU12 TaxID=2849491 RepID=UPI001C48EC35|nr:hypothetical protein [Corynebacterium sp. TAE3-ERU12]MBV7295812.1 hypothetical protein [Corynebacterium sp. TAE3-ERU12]